MTDKNPLDDGTETDTHPLDEAAVLEDHRAMMEAALFDPNEIPKPPDGTEEPAVRGANKGVIDMQLDAPLADVFNVPEPTDIIDLDDGTDFENVEVDEEI